MSLDGWKFVVVGDGRDLPSYKVMAERLGLRRISFEGYQNPLPYYKRAKIFVMTSAFEGFGMTLVESQQNGVVPIVMDTFVALHDIVENGVNGVILPNCDEQDFAKELVSLMRDARRRDRMAKKGMQTSKSFSPEMIVDQWETLFQSIRV